VASGAAIPNQSLRIIALDPKSALVEVTYFPFGIGEILVGGFAVLHESLFVVTVNSVCRLE